jgi:hypothetical protein
MKVKELIEKLKELPEDWPVVLCDLNNDGDGDGNVFFPEIHSVETMFLLPVKKNGKTGKEEEVVTINFKG